VVVTSRYQVWGRVGPSLAACVDVGTWQRRGGGLPAGRLLPLAELGPGTRHLICGGPVLLRDHLPAAPGCLPSEEGMVERPLERCLEERMWSRHGQRSGPNCPQLTATAISGPANSSYPLVGLICLALLGEEYLS
jgi:hypothetical protein